jgi:bifunctional non-homologous end joining protein LigD
VSLPRIQPLRLGRRASAFNDPDWLFELKWDGFRALAYIEQGSSRLVSRKENEFRSFPSLNAALARLDLKNAVLDGEILSLDQQGKADFNSLLFRRAEHVFFYAFDCLWLNGRDLRGQTVLERKDVLRRLLRGCPPEIRYVEHIDGNHGEPFFHLSCAEDLEGVVAKRKASTYMNRDQEVAWVKIKNSNYSQIVDRHELFEGRRGSDLGAFGKIGSSAR